MATGVSDYGTAAWLPVLFGVLTPPESYYITLLTDEPGPAMDGDVIADLEPDDPAFARQLYLADADHWAVAAAYLTNAQTIDFGAPTVDWGLINHYALCTDPTGGDIYAWGEFLSPANVLVGTSAVTVPPGGIVIALSSLDPTISV